MASRQRFQRLALIANPPSANLKWKSDLCCIGEVSSLAMCVLISDAASV